MSTLSLNKEAPKADEVKPAIIVPTAAEVSKIQDAKVPREQEVRQLVKDFKGRGVDLIFDDHGSVTFKKGIKMESIHMSSADRLIYNTAARVSR